MSKDTFERVMDFAVRESGCEPAEVTPTTKLLHDLYIDGDDAIEFFDKFFDEFGVDSTGFRMFRHFDGETPQRVLWCPVLRLASFPVRYLCRRFGWSTARYELSELEFIPIRISDLVTAVETRKWPLTYEEWHWRDPDAYARYIGRP